MSKHDDTKVEITAWDRIKSMPTIKDLRWARRVAGKSFTEVQPAPPKVAGRPSRIAKGSTRRKRAKAQSINDRLENLK